MRDVRPTGKQLGEKRLAAIMFTDVAGFSTLVQEREDATLRLVTRDFEIIAGLCEREGGHVLKKLGDGLLLSFDSAEAAVACALAVQKVFSERTKTLPHDLHLVLHHRIGIHLGDVFVTDDAEL